MSVGSLPASVTGVPAVEGPPLEDLLHAIGNAPVQLLDHNTSLSVLISDLLVDLDGTLLSGDDVDRLEQSLGASPDAQELTGLIWWLYVRSTKLTNHGLTLLPWYAPFTSVARTGNLKSYMY